MDAQIIELESKPKRKFISFEEIDWKVDDDLPMSSRMVRYKTAIHSHWAVRIGYYFTAYPTGLVVCFAIDCIILLFTKGFPWAISHIWDMVVYCAKFLWEWLWNTFGEAIKAFAVKFLKVMAIAAAAYIVYAFIATDGYSKLLNPLCKWLGW